MSIFRMCLGVFAGRCGDKSCPVAGDNGTAEVRITAIQRGPMEIGGWLGQRERQLLEPRSLENRSIPWVLFLPL